VDTSIQTIHFLSLTLPNLSSDDFATPRPPLPLTPLDSVDWPHLQAQDAFARTAFSLLHQTFTDPAAYPLFRSICPIPGHDRIRLDWSIGTSAGWVKFYACKTPDLLGPVRREFTLLTVSGRHPAEDAKALDGLRSMFHLTPHTQRPLALIARERDLPRSAEYRLIRDILPATAAAILASLRHP
jgi:hypothetical protein